MELCTDSAKDEPEASAVASEDGNPRLGLEDADGETLEAKDGSEDVMDDEVFEEAMEPPTPMSLQAFSDSRDDLETILGNDAVGKLENPVELADVQVGDQNVEEGNKEEEIVGSEGFNFPNQSRLHHQMSDGHENVDPERSSDESTDPSLPSNQSSKEQKSIGEQNFDEIVDAKIDDMRAEAVAAKIDETIAAKVDAQHIDKDTIELVAVEPNKGDAACDKSCHLSGEGDVEQKAMHIETDSLVSCSEVVNETDKVAKRSSDESTDPSLSSNQSSKEQKSVGEQKFDEIVDAKFDDTRTEAVDTKIDETVAAKVDAQHIDKDTDELVAVEPNKGDAACDKSCHLSGEGDVEQKPMHIETDSLVSCSEVGNEIDKVAKRSSDESTDPSLSSNQSSKEQKIVGEQKFDEIVDAKIDGDTRDETVDATIDETVAAKVDARHIDKDTDEFVAVEPNKGDAACDKSFHLSGEGDVEEKPMHIETDSLVSCSEVGNEIDKVAKRSSDESTDPSLSSNQSSKEQTSVGEQKFDEIVGAKIDAQHIDKDTDESVAVEPNKGDASCDKSCHLSGERDAEKEPMHIETDSLVSCSEVGNEIDKVAKRSSDIEDGEKMFMQNRSSPMASHHVDGEVEVANGSEFNIGTTSKELQSDRCEVEEFERVESVMPDDNGELACDTNSNKLTPLVDMKDDLVKSVVITEGLEKLQQLTANDAELDTSFVTNGHSTAKNEDAGGATNVSVSRINEDAPRAHVANAAGNAANGYSKKATGDMHGSNDKPKEQYVGNLNSGSSENTQRSTPSTLLSPKPENSRGSSLTAPAGLGSSASLPEPSLRPLQQSRGSTTLTNSQPSIVPSEEEEENDETRKKLQMIRVKFLRLAHRLGQTPHNAVVAQVLYRLGLAEQLKRNTKRPGVFSFDQASVVAGQLEAAGQETLDFSCTIMVIGKSGVGKTATINSIFDEVKLPTDAFLLGTKKVQEVVGMVQGIKVRVIDTPGLFLSSLDQHRNEKILHSVKKFIKKSPPDIVLYFDRLDMQSRDFGDAPLLQTITNIFGASIWFNAIVVLTHAASAPPDGPNGSPLSYDMFVTQRTHVVQQAIRQAAGDVRLMNPVSLVENHSACRMNRAGQRVLPNGQVWKPQLLLLSFASKILAEANSLLNLQDGPPGKPFGSRRRAPPLPFLLSSLLQSRPQLKLPEDQFDEDDNLDDDLAESSRSDEGSDYDELPPFKPLSKSQISKLSKAQKKAYFEELDYREKLFYKKQLTEERKQRKLATKLADMAKDLPLENNLGEVEEESNGSATVPVPLPDYVLPHSFDCDNPSHRYRFLDSSNQWLIRPVLDSQGWDHDVGYEGLNVERVFVVKDKIPLSVSGQLTKDKKECTFQMELGSSLKHSESKATSLGLEMQTVGKDIAYTLRGETRFRNFRRNNTTAGASVSVLGDSTSAGIKLEDKLILSRRFRLLMSGGAMTGKGDVAYGGRLEAVLRDKDYPIGQALSTIALSFVEWHDDLSLGCNIQSQIPFGRGTNITGHANLNNRGTGQFGIRLNSSEHLQIVLLAMVPILRNLHRTFFGSSHSM
ncbi:translocase of chloroplast 120, chloroplastic-like [Zingiber officinale]|nr:translocase of chloroplast 120, chloroplastic-like [Zingiber officinale]